MKTTKTSGLTTVSIKTDESLRILFLHHDCQEDSLCDSAPTLCRYTVTDAKTQQKSVISVQCNPEKKLSRALQKAIDLKFGTPSPAEAEI